jgi:hypothetical protein
MNSVTTEQPRNVIGQFANKPPAPRQDVVFEEDLMEIAKRCEPGDTDYQSLMRSMGLPVDIQMELYAKDPVWLLTHYHPHHQVMDRALRELPPSQVSVVPIQYQLDREQFQILRSRKDYNEIDRRCLAGQPLLDHDELISIIAEASPEDGVLFRAVYNPALSFEAAKLISEKAVEANDQYLLERVAYCPSGSREAVRTVFDRLDPFLLDDIETILQTKM